MPLVLISEQGIQDPKGNTHELVFVFEIRRTLKELIDILKHHEEGAAAVAVRAHIH